MWTYQVRPRLFRVSGGEISFPTEVTLRAKFKPLQTFGVDTGDSRTAHHRSKARVRLDSNTGSAWIEPDELFEPLDIRFLDDDFEVVVSGNKVSVTFECSDPEQMEDVASTLYFGLPVLLNMEYGDPPHPVRVDGEAGNANLSWELRLGGLKPAFDVTTREFQEERFRRAWRRIELLQSLENRRLLAAARYLYTACRLERAGNSPWEFMGEIILNLNKVLEVLFPGAQSRDAAREGLRQIGLDEDEIELNFISVLLLRSHIDSGHVLLSVFEQKDLAVLQRYCDQVLSRFRTLLGTVFDAVQDGEWSPKPYTDPTPRDDALEIIRQMEANQGAD